MSLRYSLVTKFEKITNTPLVLKLEIQGPKVLLLLLPPPGGQAGNAGGGPTGRVEGQKAEPDNLLMTWPGIGWGGGQGLVWKDTEDICSNLIIIHLGKIGWGHITKYKYIKLSFMASGLAQVCENE